MYRRAERKSDRKTKYLKTAVISTFLGMTAFFCLASVLAAAMLFIDIPEKICRLSALFILAAGAFVCGRTGGYLLRRKGIISGMLCGLLFCFCAYFTKYAAAGSFGKSIFPEFFLCISAGAAGGVSGVNIQVRGPGPFRFMSD